MGPVSFHRFGDGLDRDDFLAAARALKAAGLRVQAVDGDRAILIRSEDVARASAVLEAAGLSL